MGALPLGNSCEVNIFDLLIHYETLKPCLKRFGFPVVHGKIICATELFDSDSRHNLRMDIQSSLDHLLESW